MRFNGYEAWIHKYYEEKKKLQFKRKDLKDNSLKKILYAIF